MMLTPLLLIPLLILAYMGPYAFVYGRTATWTFPKIDVLDDQAFDGVEPSVSQTVILTKVDNVGGAQETTYSLSVGVLHRKFLDWIGFPLVLEVNDFNFRASGIYQDKVVFHCRHFETAFPRPTGTEPWYIYQPLVDRNDNTTLNVSCHGDAASMAASAPITLDWSMSANLVGDRTERERSWNSSQSIEIRNNVNSSGNQENDVAEVAAAQ